VWLISSSSDISLSFTSFSTESDYDFVTINRCYDSSCNPVDVDEILEHSGSTQLGTLHTSTTGIMQVKFTSDRSVTYSGFEADWSIKDGCA